MNYTPEDYVEFYNDQVRAVNARHGWRFVGALLLVVFIGIWLSGCDGEAAKVTAYSESEAHQRHVDSVLGWVKYQPTGTPIRASDLGADFTICQRLEDRQWECSAK